jgi:hypothetical protein
MHSILFDIKINKAVTIVFFAKIRDKMEFARFCRWENTLKLFYVSPPNGAFSLKRFFFWKISNKKNCNFFFCSKFDSRDKNPVVTYHLSICPFFPNLQKPILVFANKQTKRQTNSCDNCRCLERANFQMSIEGKTCCHHNTCKLAKTNISMTPLWRKFLPPNRDTS